MPGALPLDPIKGEAFKIHFITVPNGEVSGVNRSLNGFAKKGRTRLKAFRIGVWGRGPQRSPEAEPLAFLLTPKIHLDDALLVADVVERAFGDDAAFVQHRDRHV